LFYIFFSDQNLVIIFLYIYYFFMAPQYHTLIFSDLLEITPIDPLIMPDPYDENHSVKTNIKMFYRLLRWSSRMNDQISGLINAYYLGYLLEERLSTPSE
ncbi:MAG TPA: hypothetical protein VM660_04365, partial [Bacillus sp. (in: firmicutes)]|nr:hypothetical protein [Bacillus sp. (in: firmicutes)]